MCRSVSVHLFQLSVLPASECMFSSSSLINFKPYFLKYIFHPHPYLSSFFFWSFSCIYLFFSYFYIFIFTLFCFTILLQFESLMAQMVKNLPAMWETWLRSLECEDPLEMGMATHCSILAWRIPWTEAIVQGSQRVGHD